jgi:hypothetical protein
MAFCFVVKVHDRRPWVQVCWIGDKSINSLQRWECLEPELAVETTTDAFIFLILLLAAMPNCER